MEGGMYLLPCVTLGIFVTVVAGTKGEYNNCRVEPPNHETFWWDTKIISL